MGQVKHSTEYICDNCQQHGTESNTPSWYRVTYRNEYQGTDYEFFCCSWACIIEHLDKIKKIIDYGTRFTIAASFELWSIENN